MLKGTSQLLPSATQMFNWSQWSTEAAVRKTEMENKICFLKMNFRNTALLFHQIKRYSKQTRNYAQCMVCFHFFQKCSLLKQNEEESLMSASFPPPNPQAPQPSTSGCILSSKSLVLSNTLNVGELKTKQKKIN